MNAPPDERRVADVTAVEVAKLEGRMDRGFAELNGRFDTMIAETRAANEARALEAGGLRSDVDDLKTRVTTIETWKTITETTESAAPRLTWRLFFSDVKTWVLTLLTLAVGAWGFFKG